MSTLSREKTEKAGLAGEMRGKVRRRAGCGAGAKGRKRKGIGGQRLKNRGSSDDAAQVPGTRKGRGQGRRAMNGADEGADTAARGMAKEQYCGGAGRLLCGLNSEPDAA